MTTQTFDKLITNLTEYLDQQGLDTKELRTHLSDRDTTAMVLRLRVKPVIEDQNALEQLIPADALDSLKPDAKVRCHRFLKALCELV